LFPWPQEAVAAELARYPNCSEIFWLQEEPKNMGPWNGVKGWLFKAHGDRYAIHRISRRESGSPATGKARIHAQEQQELLDAVLGPVRSSRED